MKKHMTYCSHCEKDVHFVVTRSPAHEGHANLPDGGQVVCLDFGEQCENSVCPLAGLPSIVMGIRLARSGEEKTGGWSIVHAVCEECSFPAEFKMLGDDKGVCSVCGSVNPLTLLTLDDGSLVAATRKQP